MAATDLVYPRKAYDGSEFSVKNTSGSAIPAWSLVKLDNANPMSPSQQLPGVILTAAVADVPYGVTIQSIPAGGTGVVQRGGRIQCIAAGAIAAGATVGPSAVTPGAVTTYTAANPSLGQAETASATLNDPISVVLEISKNA